MQLVARALGELSLGWLDLGDEDQRRAKNFIAQFNADNTVDELGFGILRDAFAEIFFPATNTIMTRTRYLIFVAGLCWLIEQEGFEGRRAAQRLTELENQLREALSSQESLGVIGAHAKEELQRYPSTVYWSALRQLGLFCHRHWGLSYYQTHLKDHYDASTVDVDDDRLTHLDIPVPRNWDRQFCDLLPDGRSFLVKAKEGGTFDLPDSLGFNLTRAEARYLRGKYVDLAKQVGRPSILSHVLSRGELEVFRYPWDASCPTELRKEVEHARLFSMFVRGATLHYFHLLSVERAAQKIAPETTAFRDIFAEWWPDAHEELASWNTEEFFELADRLDPGRRSRRSDRVFVTEWLERNRAARDGPKVICDDQASRLIQDREHLARPNKGRLRHSDYLKRWRAPEPAELTEPYSLNYRAPIGAVFVNDIVSALGGA